MRKDSLFDDVQKMPWPIGVVAAVLVFFIFHTYQLVAPHDAMNQAVLSVFRVVVYFFMGMLLFAAFLSFLRQKVRSNRFRTTESISDLRSLTWRQFETFIGESFREQGYFVMETPEGPDNGVDLVLRKDGEKTYVQCKHWKTSNVGVEKIRELLGAMTAGGADNGIFVASGYYTSPANEFARECGIRLVDGGELARLLGSFTGESNNQVSISEQASEVTCPVCNALMVERVARRGPNKGNSFWGCSNYPKCRGTKHRQERSHAP